MSALYASAKDKALNIIKDRIAREWVKAEFAHCGVYSLSVKQFNVDYIGTIHIPITELDWFKLRNTADPVSEKSTDGQQVNSALTVDGAKMSSSALPTETPILQHILPEVLDPMISDLDLTKVTVHLTKAILCKAGETYSSKYQSKGSPDHLVKLLLQLPVFNGGRNGLVKVNLGSRTLDLSSNLDTLESAAAFVFYQECCYRLEPINSGHRVFLEFDLFRHELPQPNNLHPYEKDGLAMQFALSEIFGKPAEARPDALLYPLDHKYNQKNSFLKGTKGRDSIVTKVLLAAKEFCVHLALFTEDPNRTTLGAPSVDTFCTLNNRSFQLVSGSEEIDQLSYWVSCQQSPISFEVLGVQGELIASPSLHSPQLLIKTWKPQFSEDSQTFSAALVVWPKARTDDIVWKFRPLQVWHTLRRLTGPCPSAVKESCGEMTTIITYIHSNLPCLTWDGMMQTFQSVCLKHQLHSVSLDLLQAVAEYPKWPNPSVPCSLIADAINIGKEFVPPWDPTEELFQRLSNVDLWAKIGFCSALAETMRQRMFSSSVKLAQLTRDLFLSSTDENLKRTRCSYSLALYMFCLMIMGLESMQPNAIGSRFVNILAPHFEAFSVNDLVSLTIQIPSQYLALLSSDACGNLYRQLWYSLRVRDYSCECFLVTTPATVVKCFKGLLYLDHDKLLIDWFVFKISSLVLSTNRDNCLLETILSSGELVNKLNSTEHGKRALEVLQAAKVIETNNRQQPKFTWEQPDAVVSDHPEVQEFLRSPEQRFCYANFKSLEDARRFAETMERNQQNADADYCVTIRPVMKGDVAVCVMVKARGRFSMPPASKVTRVGGEQKDVSIKSGKSQLLKKIPVAINDPASKRVKLEKIVPDQTPNTATNTSSSKPSTKFQIPPQVKTIEGEFNKWIRDNAKNSPASEVVQTLLQNLVDGKTNVDDFVRDAQLKTSRKLLCARILKKYLPDLKQAIQDKKAHLVGIKIPNSQLSQPSVKAKKGTISKKSRPRKSVAMAAPKSEESCTICDSATADHKNVARIADGYDSTTLRSDLGQTSEMKPLVNFPLVIDIFD